MENDIEFEISFGLYQGLALSTCLFIIMVDVMSEEAFRLVL